MYNSRGEKLIKIITRIDYLIIDLKLTMEFHSLEIYRSNKKRKDEHINYANSFSDQEKHEH